MNHYLVHLNGAWLDVRGETHTTPNDTEYLEWHDRRDNAHGIALPGEYIPYYPRPLSDKERGIGVRREVVEA